MGVREAEVLSFLPRAREAVVAHQKASYSFLMRTLGINETALAKAILVALENEGTISREESGARIVRTQAPTDGQPGASPDDRPLKDWLTIEEARELCEKEGYPYHKRALQKLCSNSRLEYRKIGGPKGVKRYLVTKASVLRHIKKGKEVGLRKRPADSDSELRKEVELLRSELREAVSLIKALQDTLLKV